MPNSKCKDCGAPLKDGRRRSCPAGSGCRSNSPRAHLRAVEPGESGGDEKPAPRRMTVTEAATEGTELELMLAMRERIAKAIDSPKTLARDLAALTKRLADITREIASLEAQAEEEADDAANTPDEDWDEEAI